MVVLMLALALSLRSLMALLAAFCVSAQEAA
jgi:hypothetical protein